MLILLQRKTLESVTEPGSSMHTLLPQSTAVQKQMIFLLRQHQVSVMLRHTYVMLTSLASFIRRAFQKLHEIGTYWIQKEYENPVVSTKPDIKELTISWISVIEH
ncbi:uncharacterized protein LOC144292738 [Canis aureus]